MHSQPLLPSKWTLHVPCPGWKSQDVYIPTWCTATTVQVHPLPQVIDINLMCVSCQKLNWRQRYHIPWSDDRQTTQCLQTMDMTIRMICRRSMLSYRQKVSSIHKSTFVFGQPLFSSESLWNSSDFNVLRSRCPSPAPEAQAPKLRLPRPNRSDVLSPTHQRSEQPSLLVLHFSSQDEGQQPQPSQLSYTWTFHMWWILQ